MTGAYDHLLVDEYQDINPATGRADRSLRARGRQPVGGRRRRPDALRVPRRRHTFHPRLSRASIAASQVHVLTAITVPRRRSSRPRKRLIGNNRARRDKNYQSVAAEAGEIVIRGYRTPEIEARQVARAVAKLLAHGHAPRQIAVLYRDRCGRARAPAGPAGARTFPTRCVAPATCGKAWRPGWWSGSLHYLRDGESVEAMSRMGSGRRAQMIRRRLDQAPATRSDGLRRRLPAGPRYGRDGGCRRRPPTAIGRSGPAWSKPSSRWRRHAGHCKSSRPKSPSSRAALRKVPENAVVLSTIHSAKGLEWEAVFMVGDGGRRAAARQQRGPGGGAPGRLCRASPGPSDCSASPTRASVSASIPSPRNSSTSSPARSRASTSGRSRDPTGRMIGCRCCRSASGSASLMAWSRSGRASARPRSTTRRPGTRKPALPPVMACLGARKRMRG